MGTTSLTKLTSAAPPGVGCASAWAVAQSDNDNTTTFMIDCIETSCSSRTRQEWWAEAPTGRPSVARGVNPWDHIVHTRPATTGRQSVAWDANRGTVWFTPDQPQRGGRQ